MAPTLRLRQFTPFFPTSISSPSTPVTPLPDSDAAGAPPPTPSPTTVFTSAQQEAASGGDVGENFGPLLNYTIWMMTGVSFTVLMLRFYCKLSRDRRLWWDDWVLKLAWISLVIAAVMTTVSVSYGYGRPLETIDPADLQKMPRLANVAGFFSVWAAMWSKTSFALTLARISDGWILRSIWLIVITMTGIMGSSAIMVFFDIDKLVKIRYFMFATAYSGAMDLTLSILPWKIIWKLRMTRREKIGVLVAMSMGVFAAATSFVKVSRVPSLEGTDPVDSVQLVIFGIAEGATTIIAASIPVLRALIREGKAPSSPPPVELDLIEDKVPLRRGSRATEATARTRDGSVAETDGDDLGEVRSLPEARSPGR